MATSKKEQNITNEKMGKVQSGGLKKFGEHSIQEKGHTKGKNISMPSSKSLGMNQK